MAQLSLSAVAIGDDWTPVATWGEFDKIDLLALNGGVLIQYHVTGTWQPEGGKLVRAGQPISIPGLTAIYRPGPNAVRAKRATTGLGATLDVDLYSEA